jgi:hypothetical protein
MSATLEWIRRRTWARVAVTVLVVVTLPVWLVLLGAVLPFVIAYDELWGDEKPRGWSDAG